MNETLELIEKCERSGVRISIRGQNLQVDAPKGLPDSMKEALRQHKADIISALTRKMKTAISFQKTATGIKFQNTEFEIKTHNLRFETLTLTTCLNVMIAAGVKFEVSADNFQTFGASERETAFLRDNRAAVLCTLHQSLLMKYLPLDHVVRFTDEINERAAILSDGANGEPPFEIVTEVCREWFMDMSEALLKK